MVQAYSLTPEIDVLAMTFPIPGLGHLPINAFVLKAEEPLLVDTGSPLDGTGADNTGSFMAALREVIDLASLKWIWLTHADMDHVGSVHQILEEAPQARVVTTFLTVGRMSLYRPLPIERVYLLNPGQHLDLGDRALVSVRPPAFDAADTAGAYDPESRTFFSSDCFGALLQEPEAGPLNVPAVELRDGQRLWSAVDAPWLHRVDRAAFAASLDEVRQLDPQLVLSTHRLPARGITEELLEVLAGAPEATPFVGPDQAALTAMLAVHGGGE